MFIFPPFNKLLLKYVSSKQTDSSLGEFSPSDFLGARDDRNKEHARLYRSLARRLQHDSLSGLKVETPFSVEVQRFHEKNSGDPQSYREMKERIRAARRHNWIVGYVQPLLCTQGAGDKFCDDCERILGSIDMAQEVALKARSGKATVDDLSRLPWLFLGANALPRQSEPEESWVARFVSFDVILFLWVLALLASHGSWKKLDIKSFVPGRSEDLGEAWFAVLDIFATPALSGKTSRLQHGRYSLVATFLASGDIEGGPMETLAEELSAIARGKNRLTQRIVDRHVRLLVEALKADWDDQPHKKTHAEALGDSALAVGSAFGFLQYAREVGLSEIRKKYPTIEIDAAFNDGLACWPQLVDLARI